MRRAAAAGLSPLILMGVCWLSGCGGRQQPLASTRLDSLSEILETGEGLAIDPQESTDGGGSLCIEAKEPRIVRLLEVPVQELPGREIVCAIRMKSLVLRGFAFPEIWVRVPGRDEFTARGTETAIQRSADWQDVIAVLTLPEGAQPDRIRVNLAVEGRGRVWADDVRVTVGPAGSAPRLQQP